MKIKNDIKLDFSDVLLNLLVINTSRKSVDIEIDWLDTKATPFVLKICLVQNI